MSVDGVFLRLVPAVLISLMPLAGAAQEGPSFDCAMAAGAAEEAVCADPVLAGLDRALEARYAAAMQAADRQDAGAEAAMAELRATQRGWIKGRDACWKAGDPGACIAEAYRTRSAKLVALWGLEPATGMTRWICGDSEANEVITTYFATDPPSLRFEQGDAVDAGIQARTASGARYDGRAGRFIWMKGEAATYRDAGADQPEQGCRAAP
ncbi:lysozyme inhibitor LprI family protein [Mangrovicoccus algicola]|uniref:DUF1311 domain-containing protein n=1 Tax=Mangrovicoccus algicola TaxID=2771008 RepID=A0A8J7CLI6_9RHOB|nr:MliC family protein [Mangrovicoccus algicola]MBE3639826.1 DUF1311 domain-containing protein [Mangrovicoccus algicola]